MQKKGHACEGYEIGFLIDNKLSVLTAHPSLYEGTGINIFNRTEISDEFIKFCHEAINQIQAENQRPTCHLKFNQEPFSITDSHLGGIPYLPRDSKYPKGKNGQPLWLCAQINFAQMPHIDGFPTSGILQFFLSDSNFDPYFGLSNATKPIQDQWRVCYYTEIDESITEEECKAKMPISWDEANTNNMGQPVALDRIPNIPMKINFLPIKQEKINCEDYRFKNLFVNALAEYYPTEDIDSLLCEITYGNSKESEDIYSQVVIGGCKVGGYPLYPYDGDFRENKYSEWDTLLFQLDDDDTQNLDMEGTLNFVIRSEDLKKRDFSQVLAHYQF